MIVKHGDGKIINIVKAVEEEALNIDIKKVRKDLVKTKKDAAKSKK